jgi:Rrf2 family nitric oxide-sensitive transcriptional repressor
MAFPTLVCNKSEFTRDVFDVDQIHLMQSVLILDLEMRLTNYSDYALRLLIYAAVRHGSSVTITEVSKAYGISKNHLMKVAHALALAGFLETTRGRNGGLRLAKLAKDINIGQVVRFTEADSALVECFDPATNTCVIMRACRLKHVLRQALEDFFTRLDQFTLADLVVDQRSLQLLLAAKA